MSLTAPFPYFGSKRVAAPMIRQTAEYAKIPWPVTISEAPINGSNEGSYSVMVTIDCPPGTPIYRGSKCLNPPTRRA